MQHDTTDKLYSPFLSWDALWGRQAPPLHRLIFAALWVFLMFNYLYADVMSLMDSALLPQYLKGSVEGMKITPAFLLAAAVLMEVPIAMTVLSLFLPFGAARWAHLGAGTLKAVAMGATFFVGTPSLYYLFFGAIEIPVSLLIVWLAWRWREV